MNSEEDGEIAIAVSSVLIPWSCDASPSPNVLGLSSAPMPLGSRIRFGNPTADFTKSNFGHIDANGGGAGGSRAIQLDGKATF